LSNAIIRSGNLAAGSLDLALGCFADLGAADHELFGDLAAGEDFHAVDRAADQTLLAQGGLVDRRAVGEIVEIVEIDLRAWANGG